MNLRPPFFAATLLLALSLACGGGELGPADASGASDAGVGCQTHRDCGPTSDDICDPTAHQCVHDTMLFMPCDTNADCDDFYTSAYRKCSASKICTQGCSKLGSMDAPECVGKEKLCNAQGSCECTSDSACGTQICGKVSKTCDPKCQKDLDCAALVGTICETATGQCVVKP